MSKKEVEKLYKEIQSILFRLIPEKWESLYLYASVIAGRGEMFFYYFPQKTIFKPKAINCYEIANRFGINEDQYNIALKELYDKIKLLNNLSVKRWTNITISIVNCLFTIEYRFDNILNSRYTDEQRRIYWEYKYLRRPIGSYSKQDQEFIKNYKEETTIKPTVYTEGLYIEKNEHAKIKETNKNISEIQKIKQQEVKEVRNQILKC